MRLTSIGQNGAQNTGGKAGVYTSNVEEARRLYDHVRSLLNRLEELRLEWPEHPILDQLSKIAARILDLSLDTL
jgi:hypothetical protein